MPETVEIPIITNRSWEGLTTQAQQMYQSRHFQPDENYETWLDRICRTNCDSREHYERMKQYIQNYWVHPSTPISSNSGIPEQGLTVACFVQEVADSKNGIFESYEEAFYLGALGAGIGTNWEHVRHAGAKVGTTGESSGIIPFIKVSEAFTLAVSQGAQRRANQAVYLSVHHPEIMEFIHLKDPSGDSKRRALGLFNGVTVTDEFMQAVANRTTYNLIHPKTGEIVETLDAFTVWRAILTMRMTRGVPYILFIGNVNDKLPEAYMKEQWEVTTSNLCVEIVLHTSPDYSAVCILSSINIEHWDEYTTSQQQFDLFIEDCVRFLDNVLSNFIYDAKDLRGFEKAVRSAKYERSIGLGVMGYHSLLQRKQISFDSYAAKLINQQIFKRFHLSTRRANTMLAVEKGANPLCQKHAIMDRCTHVTAIAPTASISTLCGSTSQGIDPRVSNIFMHKTNVGSYYVKNNYLVQVLKKYGRNNDETWANIRNNGGSVQHLEFLTENERGVFKTAFEIKQEVLIEQAADRTPYIDQSTSLNLFIEPGVCAAYLDDVHMAAWAKGIKSLYYVRSDQPEKVDDLNISKSADALLGSKTKQGRTQYEECVWCS